MVLRGRSAASLRQNCVTVFSFSKNHFSSPSGRWSIVLLISSWGAHCSIVPIHPLTSQQQIQSHHERQKQPYGRQHTYHHYRTQRPAYEKTESLPMLGFHKQMDNRIKLLEEILSFRMQGVEFDNGDMYVDGHKAASDVRDEFVSVTEKLMDELAQCYNVLPQLDI